MVSESARSTRASGNLVLSSSSMRWVPMPKRTSRGKAAVYKHIPVYYPDNVGSVGGLVCMIGGLGGFMLPIAFGVMNDLIGVWTSCFMLLFALVSAALLWMHFAVRRMERRLVPELGALPELPEMADIHKPHHSVGPMKPSAQGSQA